MTPSTELATMPATGVITSAALPLDRYPADAVPQRVAIAFQASGSRISLKRAIYVA